MGVKTCNDGHTTARRIGGVIRDFRRLRGLSQEELGAQVGMLGTAISQLERGQQGTSLANLDALIAALRIPPQCLFPPRDQETALLASLPTELWAFLPDLATAGPAIWRIVQQILTTTAAARAAAFVHTVR